MLAGVRAVRQGLLQPKSAAIIGNCRSKTRNRLLNVKPVQIGGCNPGFKKNRRVSRPLFHKVEPAPASDVDPTSLSGIAPAGRNTRRGFDTQRPP